MFTLNESILNEAKKLAQKMSVSGEVILAILSSDGAEIAHVSTRKSKVNSLATFSVDGKDFYLGFHR